MVGTRLGEERSAVTWLWVAFVVLSSLGLSRAFACAMPFAAVATVAACTLPRRAAAATVLLVWLGNQAIGFGVMHYPPTASTFGWGGAIGVAALAALAAAWVIGHWMGRGGMMMPAVAFLAAFAADEAVLVAATGVLPSGSAAFAPLIVLRIFGIDALALGLLLAARGLARVAGLQTPRAVPAQRG